MTTKTRSVPAVFALAFGALTACGDTVTFAPAEGVTTNVLQMFTGTTALEVAGPGTVALLNRASAHTGGTTLTGGTLALSGDIPSGPRSPVGAGLAVAGGTLSGSGTFAQNITGTGAFSVRAPGGWSWSGENALAAAATVASGTLEIAGGETDCAGGLTVADGATVSVTGGTLGLSSASGAGTGAIVINGGTLKNVSTPSGSGDENYFEWLADSVSVSIGAEGAVFKDGGTTAFYAQFKMPLASSVEQGQPAAGVTFDGGNWGLYAAMAYDGPTILKNGAKLFFANAGTLPSSSAVTVGTGSELRNGNTHKNISSLTIEEGGIIGVNNAKRFTVTGSVVLPKSAKVALYNGNYSHSPDLTKSGTYDVLRVPVSYADALRSVIWSYANAANTWSHTFSVSTDATYATLSVTVAVPAAAGTDIVVAAGETLTVPGGVSVGGGNITVNGRMTVPGTLDGTAADSSGTVTVNNGGVLDVTGNIRLSNAASGRFDLYVNEGGTLRARQINVTDTFEAMAANSIHFDGATVYLIAAASGDNFRYFPRYATGYIGAKGVTFDLSDWDADGRTGWYRFSCMGLLNSDPALNGAPDGGITVRGTPDGTALFYFGTGLNGATLNGGITVEAGGKISAGDAALADDSVRLLPGSMFKSYNVSYVVAVQSLTVGAANGTEPVALQTGTFATGPALKVEDLSVLSPVEFATGGYKSSATVWAQTNMAAHPGVYTALVYRTVSPALDTSLFRLPAEYAGDYSLAVETVALTEGDYTGYTAVVMTVSKVARDNLELKSGATETQTLSADAVYGNIYVGDFNVVGNPVLTVNGGDITASTLHLAYQPADGKDSSEKHTVSYVQNGGSMTVNAIRTHYRGSDSQAGRVYAEITVNDGTLAVSGDCQFGINRTRQGYSTTFAMNGGTATVGGNMLLTAYSGEAHAPQGIVLMNAGTLSVDGTIDISSCTNSAGSTYKLDGGLFLRGGVLSAKNITQGAARTPWQRLVFDGGLYEPNAAADGQTLTGLSQAHVSANGAIVSTARLPEGGTYTIAQNLLRDPNLAPDAADGGFTKRGAGTLVLSGANTFTGPTAVEGGTLVAASVDAISDDVTVADGAVLDLGGNSLAVGRIAASGVVANGSLTVTDALAVSEGSLLAVDGNLVLAPGSVIDFGLAPGEEAPSQWIAVATCSGTVTLPPRLRARNAGDALKDCGFSVVDGMIYVCPKSNGLRVTIR